MVPVTASPRTVQFNSVQYQQVTFTTAANPPTLVIGGVTHADTMITTSWVYTAADGTLDGNMCSGGYPILACSPYLHKSGRLVVKAFVGGWEQTSTITVQCLVNPGDSVLNDATNDFQARSALMDALKNSHPESPPGGGVRHEEGGTIWRLPNGGGFQLVPYTDPNATECQYNPDPNPTPPVAGATLYGDYHTHPVTVADSTYGYKLYGCGTITMEDGRKVRTKSNANDTNPKHVQQGSGREDFGGGGSTRDWSRVDSTQRPQYTINGGQIDENNLPLPTVYRLSPHGSQAPLVPNPNAYFHKTSACGWVPSL
jgi:hypothetical protein